MTGTVGVGLSGSETGAIPGTFGTDYGYEGQPSLDALAALGVKHVRVPVKMDRLQPTPSAAFDATEAARVDALVVRVAAAGMTCKLEAHNFGRRMVSGVEKILGSAGYTQADHADFFSRLAALVASRPAVVALGYHEPHDLTATGTFAATVTRYDWEATTAAGGFGVGPFGAFPFGT